MKVQVQLQEFRKAVADASKAISGRAMLPVLSSVRITANGQLEVAATDLAQYNASYLTGRTDEEGSALVEAKALRAMLKGMSGDDVFLSTNDESLTLAAGGSTTSLKLANADDYPSLVIDNEHDIEARWNVSGELLRTILEQVKIACSTDESRQVLNGAQLEISDGTVQLTATDSYRLATRKLVDQNTAGECKIIVPLVALDQLTTACGKGRNTISEVHLFIASNVLIAVVGKRILATRLIEGDFPNWRQLMPSGMTNIATVDAEALRAAVLQAESFTQGTKMPVKLLLNQVLEVSAHVPDKGEMQCNVLGDYQGDSFVIAFQPGFLAQGIQACNTTRVHIAAHDALKPGLIQGDGDDSFSYLLMPVRMS